MGRGEGLGCPQSFKGSPIFCFPGDLGVTEFIIIFRPHMRCKCSLLFMKKFHNEYVKREKLMPVKAVEG